MKRYWLLAMSVLILAGCATPRLTNSEMVTLVEQFVVDESLERDHTISAFRLDSYAELSDEYLILRSSPMRHYLVKLVPRCNEIAFAPGILLHRRFGNSLSEGTDFIYTPDSLPFRCYINKIYPLTREQHDKLRAQIKAEVKELELKEQQLKGEEAAESQLQEAYRRTCKTPLTMYNIWLIELIPVYVVHCLWPVTHLSHSIGLYPARLRLPVKRKDGMQQSAEENRLW